MITLKFINFYKNFSKVLIATFAVCFVLILILGSKVVEGTALTEAELFVLSAACATAAIGSFVWIVCESAYERAVDITKMGGKRV